MLEFVFVADYDAIALQLLRVLIELFSELDDVF